LCSPERESGEDILRRARRRDRGESKNHGEKLRCEKKNRDRRRGPAATAEKVGDEGKGILSVTRRVGVAWVFGYVQK